MRFSKLEKISEKEIFKIVRNFLKRDFQNRKKFLKTTFSTL